MAAKLILTAGADRQGNAAIPVIMPNAVDGLNAWTPVYAVEEDGTARYLRIMDWTGGSGDKPAMGYLGVKGVGTKANASNLNAIKRVTSMTAVTDATGKATFTFAAMTPPAFKVAPQVVVTSLFTNVLAVQCRPKAGGTTVTPTGATVVIEQVGIVGGVVALAVGATVTVLIVEN